MDVASAILSPHPDSTHGFAHPLPLQHTWERSQEAFDQLNSARIEA
jgi:hypothetical protein